MVKLMSVEQIKEKLNNELNECEVFTLALEFTIVYEQEQNDRLHDCFSLRLRINKFDKGVAYIKIVDTIPGSTDNWEELNTYADIIFKKLFPLYRYHMLDHIQYIDVEI